MFITVECLFCRQKNIFSMGMLQPSEFLKGISVLLVLNRLCVSAFGTIFTIKENRIRVQAFLLLIH